MFNPKGQEIPLFVQDFIPYYRDKENVSLKFAYRGDDAVPAPVCGVEPMRTPEPTTPAEAPTVVNAAGDAIEHVEEESVDISDMVGTPVDGAPNGAPPESLADPALVEVNASSSPDPASK